MKLLNMYSSSFPYYLAPLTPNYFLQHPLLEYPQRTFLPQCERPRSKPIQNNRQNYNIKRKDRNSQTQQYFYSIPMYYSIMGDMFRLLIESSSSPQDIDPDIQTFTVLGDPNAYSKCNAVNVCMSGSLS